MEPNITSLPPETLESVLGFLPVASLRASRLVNSKWAKAAMVPMRKISAPVSLARGSERGVNEENLERFLECFGASKGNFPVAKFERNMSPYYHGEAGVDPFLQAVFPIVTELGLLVNLGRETWPKNVKYPNLTSVKLRVDYYNPCSDEDLLIFTQEMFDFIEAMNGQASNLKMISLEFGYYSQHPNAAQAVCLGAISERGVFREKLTHLHVNMSDLKLQSKISKLNSIHGVNLKTVKLNGGDNWVFRSRNAVSSFLKSQADTLISLEIEQVKQTGVTLTIPALKKLERLKIAGYIQTKPLCSRDFPKLKHFDISGSTWSHLLGCMFTAQDPFNSVKKLTVGKGLYDDPFNQDESEGILKAARFFPNVSKLEVTPIYCKMARTVYESFPNVVELTLTSGHMNCFEDMNEIITGFDERKQQQLGSEMDNVPNQNDKFELCRRRLEEKRNKSIAILQQLQTLRIRRTECVAKIEFGHFSSVVLKSMNSLKWLDLGIRSFPESDEYTPTLLLHLREKLAVTYHDPPKPRQIQFDS